MTAVEYNFKKYLASPAAKGRLLVVSCRSELVILEWAQVLVANWGEHTCTGELCDSVTYSIAKIWSLDFISLLYRSTLFLYQ